MNSLRKWPRLRQQRYAVKYPSSDLLRITPFLPVSRYPTPLIQDETPAPPPRPQEEKLPSARWSVGVASRSSSSNKRLDSRSRVSDLTFLPTWSNCHCSFLCIENKLSFSLPQKDGRRSRPRASTGRREAGRIAARAHRVPCRVSTLPRRNPRLFWLTTVSKIKNTNAISVFGTINKKNTLRGMRLS